MQPTDQAVLAPDGQPHWPDWLDETMFARIAPFLDSVFAQMVVDDPMYLGRIADAVRSDPENALIFRQHGHHLFVALAGHRPFTAIPFDWVIPDIDSEHVH